MGDVWIRADNVNRLISLDFSLRSPARAVENSGIGRRSSVENKAFRIRDLYGLAVTGAKVRAVRAAE